MEQRKGILLESGTNELEIVEFGIGNNKFGINVIKVKEIINPVPITIIPQAHNHVEAAELTGALQKIWMKLQKSQVKEYEDAAVETVKKAS